ncbi:MAG: D-alanyl-D-alanine carboxypeptidase [Bacillota bacterium]|nr:D-alanyl-D-alanine carboxypeptidase [Bacillota bacterium]
MLRFLKIFLCSILLALLLPGAAGPARAISEAPGPAQEDAPRIAAAGAALIEAHSGKLLFSSEGEKPLPPASTSKILTALLALDLVEDLDRDYEISPAAAAVEESSIYLRAGERLSLRELLAGALVHSGNDACFAIGEAVAGSEALFVYWMNMKAAALGAYSGHFCNTNGLPAEGHLISPEDLARIAAVAMENQVFSSIVLEKGISLGEGDDYRFFTNTNKLLWQDPHILGIKTGTTDAAGPCLVAAYGDGAALFISVLLNSPDRYGESLSLLCYGAEKYILLALAEKGQALAHAGGRLWRAAEDMQVLVEREKLDELCLRWCLPDAEGRYHLQLLDGLGQVLAELQLLCGK